MGIHAKRILQPSSFKRTIECPGWGSFCDSHGLKSSGPNVYSAKGLVEHKLGELCLKTNASPYKSVGQTGWHNKKSQKTGLSSLAGQPAFNPDDFFMFPIDDDMASAVDVYVQECRHQLERSVGAYSGVEVRMNLAWLVPGMFGTADFDIIEPLGVMRVTDYKGGFHLVEVGKEPGDNVQLSLYALGSLQEHNPHGCSPVVVTIVQPHAPHPDGSVRSVEYNVDKLYQWGYDVVVPAAKRAQEPGGPLNAGSWCSYCPAEKALDTDGHMLCPARRELGQQAVVTMFGPGTSITNLDKAPALSTEQLSADRLDRILEARAIVNDIIDAAEQEAIRRLQVNAENAPKRFKLKAGEMSNRKWGDDLEKVAKAFSASLPREEIFVEKIKSPAQMTTALKKKGMTPKAAADLVDGFIEERKPGSPKLVPIDDPAPAIKPSVEQMFK